jgi:CRP-like cAMP-binding protein
MEELIQWLCDIYPQSPECLAYLRSIIKKRELTKNEFLLREDEICEILYFIKKGLLVCYYWMGSVKVTDWFFWEGETVVSVDSFYDQVKSKDSIQAIEPTWLYYITYHELQYLYDHFIEFNYIGRVLTQKYFRIWHSLARNIRHLTAAERYQNLMEKYPEILQRVPLKHLATYFNMTKETISRERAKLI